MQRSWTRGPENFASFACPDYSAVYQCQKRDAGPVYARVGSHGRKTNLSRLKAPLPMLAIRDFCQGSEMSVEGGQLGRYHVRLLSLEPSFPLMQKQSDSVQLNKQKNRKKKSETLVQVPVRQYLYGSM